MSTERTYGVLLRVYTPKPEEVANRVERALRHVRQIFAVSKEFPALKRMVLVIPSDHDCGGMWKALSSQLNSEGIWSFAEPGLYSGHHSCEALNGGLESLANTVTHAIIVSGKAMSYLTPRAMSIIDNAFEKGAKVSGLAVDELRDFILAGRIQNTFAAWDIDALNQVGGFDSKIGVEEMAPLVRLIRKFGRCIAPIDAGPGKLDIYASLTAEARHREMTLTKLGRQLKEVLRVDSSFGEINFGIMPGYPRSI